MTARTPPIQRKGKQVKVGALTYAKLVYYMLDGVYTCKELAELTGLHYVTVLHYTRELHAAKAAHICEWEKDELGRDILKVYKIGQGKDAKRRAMTKAERSARYRAKKAHMELMQRLAAGTETT